MPLRCLLPGLLTAAQRNADKGYGDVAIFEVSGTYENDLPDGQRRIAGGVRRGTASLNGAGRLWSSRRSRSRSLLESSASSDPDESEGLDVPWPFLSSIIST